MAIIGTSNSETRTGTSGADQFDMSQGGNDSIAGLGGADTISMGAALTTSDTIDGGDGDDVVVLNGSYAPLSFTATTMTGVEKLVMLGGTYSVTTHDATAAAGVEFVVDGQALTGSLSFNGTAETDAHFLVYATKGNDLIQGGAGGDYFVMGHGGADTVHGGDGGDVISLGNTFGTEDVIDGGAGSDVVYIDGSYAGTIQLTGSNLIDVENVYFLGGSNYTVAVQDSLLKAGQVIAINAASLGAGNGIVFFGNAETDGSFDFYDGAGNDLINGGQQGDLFRAGHGGDDTLSGGGGNDDFLMGDQLTAADIIYGGAGSMDNVDLDGDYSAGIAFADDGLAGIERFTLRGDHTYRLTFADGNLNTGESMLISGGGKVFIDASAETDARFDLYDTKGDDTLIGGGGSDSFRIMNGGHDSMSGGKGGDAFMVGANAAGDVTINGGEGSDLFYFTYSSKGVNLDTDLGVLKVGTGFVGAVVSVENAYGSAYNDTLKGDAGYNFFSAGKGDDLLRGGAGGDNLAGGEGFDRASYTGSNAGVAVNLTTGATAGGHAQGDVLSGIEGLIGSSYADTLTGNNASNRLEGGGGADRLRGMGGTDTLVGGLGADRFIFESVDHSKAGAADTILDFHSAQHDLIVLGAIDANTNLDGNQAFQFIGNAAFSAAGQLRFEAGVLQGDVTGDGIADFVLKLTGVTSMSATDFVL